jgi:catechol 2,3-dioxygenase-like lactoylglutathione lyase family enzyme
MQLTGIHHLTAISAKPRDNLAFYTGLLGMRLVKKSARIICFTRTGKRVPAAT